MARTALLLALVDDLEAIGEAGDVFGVHADVAAAVLQHAGCFDPGPQQLVDEGGEVSPAAARVVVQCLRVGGSVGSDELEVEPSGDVLHPLGEGRVGAGRVDVPAVVVVVDELGECLAGAEQVVARLVASPTKRAPKRPRALILAPTHELAGQIEASLKPLAAVAGLLGLKALKKAKENTVPQKAIRNAQETVAAIKPGS